MWRIWRRKNVKSETNFFLFKKLFQQKKHCQKKKFKSFGHGRSYSWYLDPIRYITNESSGKQGVEVAIALDKLGIKTTLISGPLNIPTPKNIKIKKIISADDMMNEVKNTLPVDLAICTAAVSDLKPIEKIKNKIKKDKINFKSINFKKNIDILEYLSKRNNDRPSVVAGFSAETENLIKIL